MCDTLDLATSNSGTDENDNGVSVWTDAVGIHLAPLTSLSTVHLFSIASDVFPFLDESGSALPDAVAYSMYERVVLDGLPSLDASLIEKLGTVFFVFSLSGKHSRNQNWKGLLSQRWCSLTQRSRPERSCLPLHRVARAKESGLHTLPIRGCIGEHLVPYNLLGC